MSRDNSGDRPNRYLPETKQVTAMDKIIPIEEPQSMQSQASAWLAKLDGNEPSAEDLKGFKQWIAQNPAHIAEFKKVTAAWDELNLLTRLPLELEQRAVNQARQSTDAETTGGWLWARNFAMTASLLVAILFGVQQGWFKPDKAQYLTAVGEQKTIKLPDNSLVQLNTNSRLSIDYSGEIRAIYLLQGEAHFDVESNPDRPFEVYVGAGLVRAVGTAFSVHFNNTEIDVLVTEGVVEIAPEFSAPDKTVNRQLAQSEASKPLRVEAGRAAIFNQREVKQVEVVEEEEIQQRLAWQRGLLVFRGESLEEVVAELGRYTNTKIIIKSDKLRQLRIGGQFQVGDTRAIFRALEKGFGLRAEYATDNLVYLTPMDKNK